VNSYTDALLIIKTSLGVNNKTPQRFLANHFPQQIVAVDSTPVSSSRG
jgi:hypothetical protein